jgi:hypothetical protein
MKDKKRVEAHGSDGKKKAAFAAVCLVSALMLSWIIYMLVGIKSADNAGNGGDGSLANAHFGTSGSAATSPGGADDSVLPAFEITKIFGNMYMASVGGGVTQSFVIKDTAHIYWYNYDEDGRQIAAFEESFEYDPEAGTFIFSGDEQPVVFSQSGDAVTIGAMRYDLSSGAIEGDYDTENAKG